MVHQPRRGPRGSQDHFLESTHTDKRIKDPEKCRKADVTEQEIEEMEESQTLYRNKQRVHAEV